MIEEEGESNKQVPAGMEMDAREAEMKAELEKELGVSSDEYWVIY